MMMNHAARLAVLAAHEQATKRVLDAHHNICANCQRARMCLEGLAAYDEWRIADTRLSDHQIITP